MHDVVALLHASGHPPHLPHGLARRLGIHGVIPVVAVLESLAGASCYAVSTVLQQRAAHRESDELSMRPGLLLKLLRSGAWMLGNVLDVGAFGMQFLALRRASLALVSPLFVVGLVFSIIGAALAARRLPTRAEVGGSSLVVVGLVVFITASKPGPGHPHAAASAWITCFVAAGALVVASVLASRRTVGLRAPLLGLSTGVCYGLTASLTERAGHLFDEGFGHLVVSWTPYALAVVGALGLLLNQSAYQAGALSQSLPLLTVGEPVTAVLIGQLLFGERIAHTPTALGLEALAAVAVTVGVVALSKRVPLAEPPPVTAAAAT